MSGRSQQSVPDAAALLYRLRGVEQAIRKAVAQRRRADPNPDDPFRGLYLSDEAIDAVLDTPRAPFPAAAAPARPDPAGGIRQPAAPRGNDDGRLGTLATAAGLTELDLALLLVALAPDVDSRFEQLYAYLNDDVTRRRATVGLALRLCGQPEAAASARIRLAPGSPLVDFALVEVRDPQRPVLSRALRVPDRVGAYLLGADAPEPRLAGIAAVDPAVPPPVPPPASSPVASVASGVSDVSGAVQLRRALGDGHARLAYLREHPGGSGPALAGAALAGIGLAALAVDARRLAAQPDPDDLVRLVIREALLCRAGIVLGPVDGREPWPVWRALSRSPVPVIVFGTRAWNPQWTPDTPLQMDALPLPGVDRAELWRREVTGPLAPGVDPAEVTAHFVLGAPAIRRAAAAASLCAAADGGLVTAAHLRAGARSQNAAGLENLARRIEPAVGWDDLVLPAQLLAQLGELAARARYRDRVLDEWRMRPGGGRGRGITALFAGDSGTGKTMSAEVVAGSLGLDLYTINLATVVDKYVGETEKNLERIFAEAAGVNGVLLFDEADAIFGKRSEVRDAHDRYANIESAYLLQRMETFDGVAVLATNLRANLDEAFTRRLDLVVDFPMPDETARRALWDRCLGTRAPRSSDVDLDFLARSFDLAGGHIRSAAITAAYLAAEAGRPVGMAELVGAVGREYRKLGRLTLESEFGPYLSLAG